MKASRTILAISMLVVGVGFGFLLNNLFRPIRDTTPVLTTARLGDAKNYSKNFRVIRGFYNPENTHNPYVNKTEGYFDLTQEQVLKLSASFKHYSTENAEINKVRIYFGESNGRYLILVNGIDGNNIELQPANLVNIAIGSNNDCPMLCDFSKYAYLK